MRKYSAPHYTYQLTLQSKCYNIMYHYAKLYLTMLHSTQLNYATMVIPLL